MFRTRISVQEKKEKTGVSKNGNNYRVGEYVVLMFDENNTVSVMMKAFGDLNDKLVVGNNFDIGFRIDSRVYNEKLYYDFMIAFVDPAPMTAASTHEQQQAPSPTSPYNSHIPGDLADDKDDLPF